MRQAVLTAPERIEFREVPDLTAAQLGEDEILIRIKKIGICGMKIVEKSFLYTGAQPVNVP